MYRLFISQAADKQTARLPAKVRQKVSDAIGNLRDNPRPSGCKKLKSKECLWRIRVGDYRVVYTIEDDKLVVLVVRVAHRKDVYQE
jgi:mRNA interferase RelE/StbE